MRYGDFTSFGQSKKIKTSTNSTTDLYLNLKNLFSKLQINKPIRKIGVWIGEIQPDNGQLPLLSGRTKMAELDKTTDRINKKYGKLVVKRSSLVNLGFDGAAPAFGFKKVI